MSRKLLALVATLVLPAALQAQTAVQHPHPNALALARKYTEWFFAGQMDSLIRHMPVAEGQTQPTVEQLQERLDMVTSRAGNETEVIEEMFVKRNGAFQYWRTSRFDNFPEPFLFRWVIDEAGNIQGMGLGPRSQAPPTDS